MLRESIADKELNPDSSQMCELSEPDFYLFSRSNPHKDGWRTGEDDSRPLFSLLTFQAYILRDSHGSSIYTAIISINIFWFFNVSYRISGLWDTTVYSKHQGNTGPPHCHGPSQTPMLESHPLDISLQLCMTDILHPEPDFQGLSLWVKAPISYRNELLVVKGEAQRHRLVGSGN